MTFRSSLVSPSRRYCARGGLLAVWCALIALIAGPGAAAAAQVHGILVAYEGGAQGGRNLHFQNEITQDSYMVITRADGSFGTQLPPGVYAVRAERGAILARGITVGRADVGLGQVSDLAPYAPGRLWHLQGIAPSLLSSPAPSTANIMLGESMAPPAPATR